MSDETFFEVLTPLGFRVRTSRLYWETIVSLKHPVMNGRQDAVVEVLKSPVEIRRSHGAMDVYLFYRLVGPGRWVCVVVKRLNGDGFLVTTYLCDAIKEGERVWNP